MWWKCSFKQEKAALMSNNVATPVFFRLPGTKVGVQPYDAVEE